MMVLYDMYCTVISTVVLIVVCAKHCHILILLHAILLHVILLHGMSCHVKMSCVTTVS
jgi:hypothetical protein